MARRAAANPVETGRPLGGNPKPEIRDPKQIRIPETRMSFHERRAVRLPCPSKSLRALGRRDALPYVHGPIASRRQREGFPQPRTRHPLRASLLRISAFGLPSDFGLRTSDFGSAASTFSRHSSCARYNQPDL